MTVGCLTSEEGIGATQDASHEVERVLGFVSAIQRFSVQDGPGIRTTVFFKGCPLRCAWCSNPETQNASVELGYVDTLCVRCGRCAEVCSLNAITIDEQELRIDRQVCTSCGECVAVCRSKALRLVGEEMSVEDVLDEVMKDAEYYRMSDGGVTFSGGEPLSQLDFLTGLAAASQSQGLHTALETCGYAPYEALAEAVQHIDLVLYDLKHMDSSVHQRLTRVPNELILANARKVVAAGAKVVFRVPLIPGVNDSEENIEATCEFAMSTGGVSEIDLLPYHRFGKSKYKMLSRPYELDDMKPPLPEDVERLQAIIEGFGLVCHTGG